jgi:hypothetical protein
MATRIEATKPPAADYLFPVPEPRQEGPKCQHTKGQWIIVWEGKQYAIVPSNNLQMNTWLNVAERKLGRNLQDCVKWLCWECGTIQIP